ncbi:hypothetical protein [Actinoplanes couchii]|uniref:hypothetical protein n=1 Tax=Actinoplanes couchii TaxID=403638 RepID=UPI001940AD52|nr:hypothetical protein [Actinoplanes couchii]MDR6320128.1 hypothetical protein [Actinoplanes couchii]
MIQNLQVDDVDNSKSRSRVGYRLFAMTNRIALAAVTGLASGLMRAAVDWLLQVLGS